MLHIIVDIYGVLLVGTTTPTTSTIRRKLGGAKKERRPRGRHFSLTILPI